MTTNTLTLLCLVDGEATSNAFPVEIESTKIAGHLKDLIKAKIPDTFSGVDAKDLTLWRVSHPVIAANKHQPVLLSTTDSPTELDPTDDIADVFAETPPKKTIHIIVQRPAPQVVHAPVPSRSLTSVPGYPSDASRPSTPLSGDLHADIKRITDTFFAPGSDVAKFLGAFVRGQGALPVTSGPIRGLPRAWRRGLGKAPGEFYPF